MPELKGSLNGTIESGSSGILSIRGTAAQAAAFRIDLLTSDGESASDSALQVRFPGGALCEGTLTSLDQTGFTGSCALAGSGTRTVQADWTVSDRTVAGTITTTAAATAA